MVPHEAREICIGFHARLLRCVRAPGRRRAWHGGADPTVRATDRWLLSVLQRQLRGAPIRLTLWDGTSAYSSFAPPVGTVLVKDRLTLVRLLRSRHVAFWRGVQLGSPRGAGRPGRMPGGGVSHEPQAYTFDPSSSMERARGEHVGHLSRQHPPPLRYRERLLRAVARPAARVHLCVLSVSRHESGGGAGGQDGPRLPQVAAEARREGHRGRVRVGRSHYTWPGSTACP